MIELFLKLDKLDNQKHNLIAEIINLPDPVLHHKSRRGELSVVQKLENLRLAEKNALKSIQRNLELKSALIDSPLCVDVNMFFTKIALATKLPIFTYPLEVFTDKKPDFDYLISDWSVIRENYRQTISSFVPEMSNKIIYKHPILGLMSMEHLLDFFLAYFKVYEKQVLKQLHTVY
jgi:hypothetical protein